MSEKGYLTISCAGGEDFPAVAKNVELSVGGTMLLGVSGLDISIRPNQLVKVTMQIHPSLINFAVNGGNIELKKDIPFWDEDDLWMDNELWP